MSARTSSPPARGSPAILKDLDAIEKLKSLIISQARAIWGYEYPLNSVFDVITDRDTNEDYVSDGKEDHESGDEMEEEDEVAYYSAHLIVYVKSVSHSNSKPRHDWKLLRSNPDQNCVATVDAMADLHCCLQESMFIVTGPKAPKQQAALRG